MHRITVERVGNVLDLRTKQTAGDAAAGQAYLDRLDQIEAALIENMEALRLLRGDFLAGEKYASISV
jgi:hypothetical protein